MSKNNNKEDNNFEYEIVLNRYKIEKKIGKGSFGTVFSAIDQESKEKLAIKTEVDNPENPLGLLESEDLFLCFLTFFYFYFIFFLSFFFYVM